MANDDSKTEKPEVTDPKERSITVSKEALLAALKKKLEQEEKEIAARLLRLKADAERLVAKAR